MAKLVNEISRTFSEFLIIPRLTQSSHTPHNVDLKAPVAKYAKSSASRFTLNIPFVSASMQSVSGADLAIALARKGGLAFIYCSQPIADQAEMVAKVKSHKAGFVQSDSNLRPDNTLADARHFLVGFHAPLHFMALIDAAHGPVQRRCVGVYN